MKKKYLQETLNALRKIPFDSPIMKGKLVQLKDGRVVILHRELKRLFTNNLTYENKLWGCKTYRYSELKNGKFETKNGLLNSQDFTLIENLTDMLLIDNLQRSVRNINKRM